MPCHRERRGLPHFTRAPEHTEIEDQVTRSNSTLAQWQDELQELDAKAELLAQASTPGPDALSHIKELRAAMVDLKPVVKDFHLLMSARTKQAGWPATTRAIPDQRGQSLCPSSSPAFRLQCQVAL